MSNQTSKSTKRRRFLGELDMIELTDHGESEVCIQHSIPSCSNSDSSNVNSNTELSSLMPSASNQLNDISEFDSDRNPWDNEYDAISLSSDIEDENISINDETDTILNDLATWAVSFNVTQVSLSALLKVLKKHKCFNYFLLMPEQF